jgi:hypothetical protein
MNKLMIATATAAALFASVGAASAQTWQNDGYRGTRGGMMTDRNVGMQTGPADEGMYAEQGWNRRWSRDQARTSSPYDSRVFQSQELYPQSPPGGGY